MILSAGIIIARQTEGQWLYLCLRAYDYWDFPKGEVEEGETPFTTAQREVREETGLQNLTFPWGRIYRESESYRNGQKKARYYLAATGEAAVILAVNPEIGHPEHDEYRWVDIVALKKLVSKRLQPIVDWAREIVEHG